jgi:hypothetical protein
MAFSDYKNIGQTQEEFGIKYRQENFVPANRVEVSGIFQSEFEFTIQRIPVFRSESARAEAVIFPILREVYKNYSDRLALWSHEPIAYDEKLCGAPDYLIATQSPLGITVLAKPLLAVVEAKKNDFEYGWGQCLAELVAAQKINDNANAIYGIVSDGQLWQIGKLENDIFTLNLVSYTIGDLPELFGALHFIFQAAGENI